MSDASANVLSLRIEPEETIVRHMLDETELIKYNLLIIQPTMCLCVSIKNNIYIVQMD